MKNFNLIEWLQTDGHGKQSATRNQVGTKQGKKGTSLAEGSWVESRVTLEERRGNHAVITRKSPGNHPLLEGIWKYVAMIFAVLVMSVANIGMAWGTDITWNFANAGSAISLNGVSTHNVTADDGASVITFNVGGSGDVRAASGTYIKINGKSGTSSGLFNSRWFSLKAPSAAGKFEFSFDSKAATMYVMTGASKNILLTSVAGTASSTSETSVITNLTAGTTDLYIAVSAAAYIKYIKWIPADAPADAAIYTSLVQTTMSTGATLSSSSASQQNGGSGVYADYSKYYKTGSSGGYVNISFTEGSDEALALNSNGSNRGRIRIYYGGKSFTLSVNGSATGITYTPTTSPATFVNIAEYTIPNGTTELSSIRMTDNSGSSGGWWCKVEVLTHPGASCTAPNHVDISGAWDRFGGETISLTATAYSSAGTGSPIADANITGWQWQKLIGSTWTNVSNGTSAGVTTSGATTKNLQISNCGQGNSGKYRCVVSTGATCSTPSATATDGSEGFGVKVYTLECYTGGTTVYNFTRDGNNQRGSVNIDLSASTSYEFKVHVDNDYYGNNGTVNSDITNWVLCNNDNEYCNPNLHVNSGLGGTFTFTMDYSTSGASSVEGEPEISVTYPRKRIYLSPGVWAADGAKFAYNYWRDGVSAQWTDFLTSDDCGMYADIPQWNGVTIIPARLNSSTVTPGSWDDRWNQTNNITITSNDYIQITGWEASDFTYNSTYAAPTYTISYNKGTSGSGTKSDETKTCGIAFTLPSSAVFTRTGYTQTGWTTSDGGAQEYALGGTYTTNEDKTFYPVWTVNNYDLTWNLGGGTTTSAGTGIASDVSVNTTSSVAFGTALTAPTVTKTGYNFSSWSPSVASTMPAANTTYTATWTVKTTTITIDANSGNHGSTTPGNVTATWGSVLPSFTAAAGESGYSLTGYFTAATEGDKIINADGTLVASTSYADGSGHWNSEAATLTLYAQYVAAPTGITAEWGDWGSPVVNFPTNTSSTISGDVDITLTTTLTAESFFLGGRQCGSAYHFDNGDYVDISINKGEITAVSVYTWNNCADVFRVQFFSTTSYDAEAVLGYQDFSGSGQDNTDLQVANAPAGSKFARISRVGGVCWENYLYRLIVDAKTAPTLTAISADVLYQAASMANITFTGEDQAFTGLSSNSLFMVYGATSPTNYAAKGKNENHDVTDDISEKNFTSALYILSNSNTTSTDDPTQGAIEIITPSTPGILYLYLDANNSALTLKKQGTSTSTSLSGAAYKAMTVDANTHYFINGASSGKRGLYGIQYVSTYAVTITPTNVTQATGDETAIKGKAYTATFTANTGYTLPSDATVSIGGTPQTKGTDYTWSISDGTATLTVPAAKVTGAISIAVSGVALPTHTVSYYGNGSTSGEAPTDANAYVEGADVTVLGKNTLVKTNNGFAGWNTATDGNGTWRVQGETFSMGAANVALHAQWVPTANLTVGTLYTAGDMKAKAIGSSTGYRPGYSSNGIFELLGVGTAEGSDSPMKYDSDSRTIDGTAFTHVLEFEGQGAGSPSGTTLPTARAIKFHVGESGTLHLWVRTGSKINIVKDGGSASAVGSSTGRTHERVEVTAGTWYLYATGSSTSLYGMKLMTCTNPELAYGTTAVAKNYGDVAFTNPLTKAAGASPIFSSDNPSVATVDDGTGEVTIVGVGSATITASISDDATYCDDEASYTLTVYPSYTVTYNAMGGTCGTESAVTEFGKVTLPSATHGTYTTYTWVTYDGAFVGYVGEEYEPSGDITLYAKWQGDCAAGGGSDGVLFSAEFKDSGLGASNICTAANDPVIFTTDQLKDEPKGGSISAYTTNNLSHMQYVTNGICIHGTDGVIKITLDAAINTNDLFEYVNVHSSNPNAYLRHTSASNTTDQIVLTGYNSKNVKVMLPAAFNGKKELYIVKQSTDFKLHKAAVVRPAFLMLLRDDTPTADTNLSGTDEALTTENYLEVIRGGSASYTSPTSGDLIIKRSANKNYLQFNKNTGYLKITLNEALQEGDVIGFDSYNNNDLALTTTAERSTSILTTSQLYTVGPSSPLKGQTTFYLWQYNGSTDNLRGLQIARSAVVGSSCYAVIYEGNGADGGYTNDPTAYDNENNDVTVAENGFTRTDYAFVGWNTANDGSGTPYAPLETISDIDDDVTLYAQWKQINYFTNDASTGYWNNTGNWSMGSLPTIDDPVVIREDVTVDINNAKALRVDIETGNTLTINAGKALIIAETLTKNGGPTSAADVIINSTREAGTGALIIGGETGTNAATMNFETKAKLVGGSTVNQFIGSPFSNTAPYVDYGQQLYKFVPRANGDRGWWQSHESETAMTPFWGYNVLCPETSYLDLNWTGNLNASTTKTITDFYYNGSSETDNMFANSWTAPIHVGAFEDGDFVNASTTLYMFNAGTPAQEAGHSDDDATNGSTEPGTYISIPIHSAPYAGIGVIPSMQAFYVLATGSSASLTLDYNKIVYTPALTSVGITPNRAPKRDVEVDEPEVIKLRVQSETGWAANTYVLGRADFAEGYEDGWDGAYIEGESATPKLYTPSVDGNMFVNCLPQIDGTVVGFRKGSADSQYTFTFGYEGNEEYYLKDLKLDTETRIDGEHSYTFTAEAEDNAARFIIIRKTPTIATGVEDVENGTVVVRKLIIDDKVYIIRGGMMYDVTGKMIK